MIIQELYEFMKTEKILTIETKWKTYHGHKLVSIDSDPRITHLRFEAVQGDSGFGCNLDAILSIKPDNYRDTLVSQLEKTEAEVALDEFNRGYLTGATTMLKYAIFQYDKGEE